MYIALCIDCIKYCRKGGGFATACRPCNDDNAMGMLPEILNRRGYPEILHGRDVAVDQADSQRESIGIAKGIDAAAYDFFFGT